MDASPQDAIVVQAIRVPDPSNAGRADLPGRPEVGAERQLSPTLNEDYRIQSLLPMPFFSRTVHTDTNGVLSFRESSAGPIPGSLPRIGWVHCPDGGQEPGSPAPILIEPGRTNKEVNFVIPEVKKGVWTKLPYTIETRPVTHYAIYRTPDGMLWVGTEDLPLHRYDGVEYKSFPVADRPEDSIHGMDCAPDGSLWIGGANGISRVVAGQFEPLPIADSLPRNGVREVAVGADGSVWFGTKSGLCKYDGRQFVRFTTQDGLPGIGSTRFCEPRTATLWLRLKSPGAF